MRRLFVESSLLKAGEVCLEQAEAKYALRVLRLGVGAQVELFDGCGQRAVATITQASRRHLSCLVEQPSVDPGPDLPQICSALPVIKGERLDLAVRMLTELGVASIQLVECGRAVAKMDAGESSKLQRLRRISLAAARQCGRRRQPRVMPPVGFAGFVEAASGLKMYGHIEHTNPTAEQATAPPQQVTLLTGPEGGFDETELGLLEQNQFAPITLGPHVLRAETAAVVAVAMFLQRLTTIPQ